MFISLRDRLSFPVKPGNELLRKWKARDVRLSEDQECASDDGDNDLERCSRLFPRLSVWSSCLLAPGMAIGTVGVPVISAREHTFFSSSGLWSNICGSSFPAITVMKDLSEIEPARELCTIKLYANHVQMCIIQMYKVHHMCGYLPPHVLPYTCIQIIHCSRVKQTTAMTNILYLSPAWVCPLREITFICDQLWRPLFMLYKLMYSISEFRWLEPQLYSVLIVHAEWVHMYMKVWIRNT